MENTKKLTKTLRSLGALPKPELLSANYPGIRRKEVGDVVVGVIIFIYGLLGLVLVALVFRVMRKG